MNVYSYAIVLYGEVLAVEDLPEPADPEGVLGALCHHDAYHWDKDLCFEYYTYAVVQKDDPLFEQAEYRVFRFVSGGGFRISNFPRLSDLRIAYGCREMDYRLHRADRPEVEYEPEDDEEVPSEISINIEIYPMLSSAMH